MKTVLRLTLLGALAITCLVGTASGASAACPNESLRYGYGANLPDCRAYEQATPVNKDGTNAQLTYNSVQAAADGGGVTFVSQAGVPGATGAAQFAYYLSTRGAAGWTTQGLLPPASTGQESFMLGWTPDLAESFADSRAFGAGTELLARSSAAGSLTTISPYREGPSAYVYVGASADGSLVFFEERKGAQLTPEAVSGKDNLYVWNRESGTLSLVGVLPESACGTAPCTPAGGSFAGQYLDWQQTGGYAKFRTQAQHAISATGSRAYFTDAGTGQIYLRENPGGPTPTTVQITASQKTNGSGPGGSDPNGPKPGEFWMATPNGESAFFTSAEELTNNANTGASAEGSDLYRYEAKTGVLTDLTPDATDPNGAEVQAALGVSEDGSYVYFAANGDLDGSGPATTGDCKIGRENSAKGECSLYVWHDGKVTFAARLDANGDASVKSSSDASNWVPTSENGTGGAAELNTSRVSVNGEVLLFRSQNSLAGYESSGIPEYYRYDAATGHLACVSCNPSGISPSSEPTLHTKTTFNFVETAGIQTRNMSATGDEFFFETSESLLRRDTNGVSDAYEWEADGAGSCSSSADGGGCLYLLSTGTSPDPSHFADASTSGEDVFIFTDQPLVGQDQDELVDVYDVRVDGGLASQNPQPAPLCSGEGCKQTGTSTPLITPPGSSTFTGAGNLLAPSMTRHRECAKATARARHLRHRLRSLRARMKKLHRRIHGLRDQGSRARAIRAHHRLKQLRRKARGVAKRHRAAVKSTKCTSGGLGSAK